MVDEYAFALANIAVFGDLIILHQPYLLEFEEIKGLKNEDTYYRC